MKDLVPLQDRVLVQPVAVETKTPGGLLLPETSQEAPQIAKVLAVGEGLQLPDGKIMKPKVRVGDEVLFAKYAGTELPDGTIVMREGEILAIYRPR